MLESWPHESSLRPCSMALGRSISTEERRLIDKYLNLLIKWQWAQRLTASSDPRWIIEHLIADSFLFFKVLPAEIRTLIDIGSGAGFPGIPLKIVKPDLAVTLVESRQRRASFLRAVARELELSGIKVVDQRLETLSRDGPGFDAATMRCAGPPHRLMAATLELLRPGGIVVVSGPPADEPGIRKAPESSRQGRGRQPLERVTVPGLHGRARQFLVARKS